MTVLSPRGVPTPLAATRLLPPDSLMAPIDAVQFRAASRPARSHAKYGATVDRDSAYERITARIAAAKAAPPRRRPRRRCGPGVDPTTATGMNTMTPAQQQREIARQAKELGRRQKARRARARAQGAGRRPSARRARQAQQKTIDTAIRTGGKVVTLAARSGHHPRRVRNAVRWRQGPLSGRAAALGGVSATWLDPAWRAETSAGPRPSSRRSAGDHRRRGAAARPAVVDGASASRPMAAWPG